MGFKIGGVMKVGENMCFGFLPVIVLLAVQNISEYMGNT